MKNEITKIVGGNLVLLFSGGALWVVVAFKVLMTKTSMSGTEDLFSIFIRSKMVNKKTRVFHNFLVMLLMLLSPLFLFSIVYIIDNYTK